MFLNFVCLLLLFQYAYPRNDIELEGRMRIGNAFMKQLTQNFRHGSKKDYQKLLFDVFGQKFREHDQNIDKYISQENRYYEKKDAQLGNNIIFKRGEDLKPSSSEESNEWRRNSDRLAVSDLQHKPKVIEAQRRTFNNDLELSAVDSNKQKVVKEELFPNSDEDEGYKKSKKKGSVEENSKEIITAGPLLPAKKNITKESEEESINSYLTANAPSQTILMDAKTEHFFNHIVENGKNKIKSLSEILQSKLGVHENYTSTFAKLAIDTFTKNILSYITYITRQEVKSDIDREFLLLDTIASCNLLLYSEQRKLLNMLIEKNNNNVTQYDIDFLTKDVYEQNVNHKRQEIFYICQELNVCRSFPGFSDYFADLISEILKLPDDRIVVVVEHIAKHIRNRPHFFKSFMKDDIADMIGMKLEIVSSDLYELKETLSVIRSIITQRFKLMKTQDYQLKKRTKAVRILIDIIDKTFSLAAGEGLTMMTFDTVVNALRRWASGTRDNIDIPIKLLIEHIVGAIRHHWDDTIRDEVATLTEVIMIGKTSEVEVYKELFSSGTAFGKGSLIRDGTY